MLRQVLIALTCSVLATTVQGNNPCMGAPAHLPHSFAASPVSCDSYIVCMNGQAHHGPRCDPPHMFEPRGQICGQSSCMDCSPFGVQNLPHPQNCEQYIECIIGNREIRTCGPTLRFDRTIGHCNFDYLVECPHDPPPPTDDPFPTGDPTWPTGDPTWPTGDPTWPTQSPPPPGGDRPVCIPGGQVHHAHPTDCTRFFMCIGTIVWDMQCPNNLHWSQVGVTCNLPEHAGCLIPGPPGPPGPPGGGGGEPTLFPPTSGPWNVQNEQILEDEHKPESPELAEAVYNEDVNAVVEA